MKNENICVFYASKYHLSVILYEYLRKKNRKEIITFLQEGIEEEINILEDKIKNKIKNKINFNSNNNIQNTIIEQTKNITFIIGGNNSYIKEANDYVRDQLKHIKNAKAKIINCYDFTQQRELMKDIINGSDKILYTTGEKVID